MHCGEKGNSRCKGGEGQADMGDLSWHVGHVMSGSVLLARAMCGSLVLLQLGSVLVPMACVITKYHKDVQGLDFHLRLY